MISNKTMATVVIALSIFSSLFAEDKENHPICARIDLIGNISTPKVALDPNKDDAQNCSVTHQVWEKEDVKKYRLTAQSVVLSYDKWLKCEFSFTPQADGDVELNLLSDFTLPPNAAPGVVNAHWVYYSDLKVKGGEIRNENFTERDPETDRPVFWTGLPENLVKSPDSSKVVKDIVKAWHFCRMTQRIKVKAGQKVTISFKSKACKFVPADKVDPKFRPKP